MTLLILLYTGIILCFVSLIVKFFSTEQVWPWLWFISIIGLSILLFLILIAFGVIPSNDDLKGFAGNIAAEGVGIVLTVFIIDRLIKRREEERLLPTRQIVYARLLPIIDCPLWAMSQIFPGEYCKSRFTTYTYGFTTIPSDMVFDDLSTLRASILMYVEQVIEEHTSIQVSTGDTTIVRHNVYSDALLSTALDQIHRILSVSNFMIEPVLMNMLLQFDRDCTDLKTLTDAIEEHSIPNTMSAHWVHRIALLQAIEKTMITAIYIREFLIGRADYHTT